MSELAQVVPVASWPVTARDCRTAYVDSDLRLIMSHGAIARNYLSGWFWIDLVSSIPWALIADSVERDSYSAIALALVRHVACC